MARFCMACGQPLQVPPLAENVSPQPGAALYRQTGQSKFKGWVSAVGKGWLIAFAVIYAIVLPSCFILGFYTNRILWMLGLR